MSNQSRPMGKFYISSEFVKASPDEVMAIMGRCIILRAEYIWHLNAFEYFALCDDFDLVDAGAEAPCYEWGISRTYGNGKAPSIELEAVKR